MNIVAANKARILRDERNAVGELRDARYKLVMDGVSHGQQGNALRKDPEYQDLRVRYQQVDREFTQQRRILAQSLTVEDVLDLARAYARTRETKGKFDTVGGFRNHIARHFDVDEADIKGVVSRAVRRLVKDGELIEAKADRAPGGRPHGVPGTAWVYGTPQHVEAIEAEKQAKAETARRNREMNEAAYTSIVALFRQGSEAEGTESIDRMIVAAAAHIERKGR